MTHDSPSTPLSRKEKLLRREIRPCDDPICSCEAEPRWLLLQQQDESPDEVSEWESLQRTPRDEF